MQKVLLITLLTAGLVVARAVAENPAGTAPSASPAAATPSANPRIEVYGDFPSSLAGTWLIVINTGAGKDHGKDRYMNAFHIYRLTVQDKHWQFHELDREKAPPALGQSVVKENKEATKFQPTPENLEAVTAVVSQLPELQDDDVYTKVVLRTADQFEKPEPRIPAYLQGAVFSIEILERPQEGQSRAAVGFYAKDVAPARISGDSQTAVVAVSGGGVFPFAAPGTFTMYRIQ